MIRNDGFDGRRFPKVRLRRLRRTASIRELFQETRLSVRDLVSPLFVSERLKQPTELESLPGIFCQSAEGLVQYVEDLYGLGIKAFIIFGIPSKKDIIGNSASRPDGIVQKSVDLLRKQFSDSIVIISDVCLCQYTTHGHCGILENGVVSNDKSLEILSKIAVSHAQAGVDFVAPSAMMDGQVSSIRKALDTSGLNHVGIIGYSAKFSSVLYSPFRDIADSSPHAGDRKSYQMPITNSEEAMQEIFLDIEEGADAIMIKPALSCLDLIYRARQSTLVPVCAFSVSGEYAMLRAAAIEGFIDENEAIPEFITSIKRAGADIIITYHAKKMAELLQG
jgi:porphobilinogen synthase